MLINAAIWKQDCQENQVQFGGLGLIENPMVNVNVFQECFVFRAKSWSPPFLRQRLAGSSYSWAFIFAQSNLRYKSIEIHLIFAGTQPWVDCQHTQDYKHSCLLHFPYANIALTVENRGVNISVTLKYRISHSFETWCIQEKFIQSTE